MPRQSISFTENIRAGYRRCQCGLNSIYFRINNSIVNIMAIIGG
ncbi:hypothetical protein ACOJR9_16445 [Alteromonas sp. A081]